MWLARDISGCETDNVVRYGPRHVDLIRSWSLVASRHRNSELVSHVEQPRVGLVDLVHEDGAGLGLDAAVEVAGDVVRHRAILAAVSLQAGLGPLQRVSELEGAIGRSLAWRLNRKSDKEMSFFVFFIPSEASASPQSSCSSCRWRSR